MSEPHPLRILIVDDQKLFAESLEVVLRDLFDEGTEVTSINSPERGIALLKNSSFDLLLVDLQMPTMDGFEFCRQAREIEHSAKVVVLTAFGYDEYIKRAFEVGASGYLLKDLNTAQLRAGLESIIAGNATMPPESVHLIERSRTPAQMTHDWLWELTRQERRVLRHIAQGFSNREISERMHLARQTVQNYVSGIYDKIGAEDRFEAIRLAIEAGLSGPTSTETDS